MYGSLAGDTPKPTPVGVAQGRLQNDRVLAFGRQERQRAVGRPIPLAVSEPGGGIPRADPFQEIAQLVGVERLGLGRRRFDCVPALPASSPAISSSAIDRTRASRSPASAYAKRPSLQDQVWPLAHPVDRVDVASSPFR